MAIQVNGTTVIANDRTIINVNSVSGINSITAQSNSLTFYSSSGTSPNFSNLGDVSLSSINSGPISGSRNRIINGDMRIDQRNSGASQTFTAAAALAYSVDRWYGYCTGANVTGQRVVGSGATQYRYQFTGAASVTAIGFGQRIEAINCYDLNNTTATLSVDLANSLLTTVTWTAYYANSADTFGSLASPTRTQISTGTFTVNSTVTRYSTTISVPSAATTGIEIVFTVGQQTSGTWTIGNVQLEAGSIATPFERRSFGQELALCQRYYWQISGDDCTLIGQGSSSGSANFNTRFHVPMRVAPTVTVNTPLTADVFTIGTKTFSSVLVPNVSISGFRFDVNGSSGITVGNPSGWTGGNVTITAEL